MTGSRRGQPDGPPRRLLAPPGCSHRHRRPRLGRALTLTAETAEAALTKARAAVASPANDDDATSLAAQLRTLARQLRAARWSPYPWQHPHRHPPGWVSEANGLPDPKGSCDNRCHALPTVRIPTQGAWLLYGGRGTGKTEAASHYVNRHMEGPPCDVRAPGGHRILIIAPTQPDAVKSCITGVSGVQIVNPQITVATGKEGTVARWPNGAVAFVLGAHGPDDVERARASGNTCLIYLEEFAAQRQGPTIKDIAAPGLRLGPNPHFVIATTPKPRPEIVALARDKRTVVTRGRTRDAYRLPVDLREVYEEKYGGTTLGRQELDAEELEDAEGSLWVHHRPDRVDGEPNKDERPGIDNDRVDPATVGWSSHLPGMDVNPGAPIQIERVVIAVDPPGGRTECGITVEGRAGGHGYTLADLSMAGPPDTWALIALHAYLLYGAEGIAAEHAYGGDMVTDAIRSRIDALQLLAKLPANQRPPSYFDWPEHLGTPPIFKVPTKVGKRLRAEPVQALYQQHREHHVGIIAGLEAEQCSWEPGVTTESPNRIDAHVHGQTFLLIRGGAGQVANPVGTRIPGR